MNHSKHACMTCGMRRSWAEVASNANKVTTPAQPMQPAPQVTGQKRSTVATMLEEVAASLSSAALPVTQPSVTSVTPACSPKKATLQAEIKVLVSALELIPDSPDNAELRRPIMAKIEAKKSAIAATNPLGQRIDGCRGALERSQSRQVQAAKSVSLAQEALRQAEAETVQLTQQLHQLEQELATHPEQNDYNSIEVMAAAMSKIISGMKSSPLVAPEILQEAETHMTNLLQGVRNIAAATASPAQAASLAGKHKANGEEETRRRVRGKTDVNAVDGPFDTGFGMSDGPGHRGDSTDVEGPFDTGYGMSDGPAFRS